MAANEFKAVKRAEGDPMPYEIERGSLHETAAGTLPSIWLPEPVFDAVEGVTSRARVALWPEEMMRFLSPDEEVDDVSLTWLQRCVPLDFGAHCYNVAMRYRAPEDHELRLSAFKAAEVLYRWAAAAGNVVAVANLGYVYGYNRCEGEYWDRALRMLEGDETARAWECPHEEWAYRCYRYAADHGDEESCYKLGDMLRWGRGCEVDEEAALGRYHEAYERSKDTEMPWWGPAALRLGTCYEEGIGCELDRERAHEFYGIARDGLADMVEAGDWFYKRSLGQAEEGFARTAAR